MVATYSGGMRRPLDLAMTLVGKSITEPGTYTSGMPMMKHADWLRNAAHLRRLDGLADMVKATAKNLGDKK